jgi:hypothetical protein
MVLFKTRAVRTSNPTDLFSFIDSVISAGYSNTWNRLMRCTFGVQKRLFAKSGFCILVSASDATGACAAAATRVQSTAPLL